MPAQMDYTVYFLILFFSIITGLFVYFLGFILRYKTKENAQNPDYKDNLEIEETKSKGYKANFLKHAVCFLIFEAACVIMFPFAYVKGVLDIFYCTEILIFILILILILLFSIKSGLLETSDD